MSEIERGGSILSYLPKKFFTCKQSSCIFTQVFENALCGVLGKNGRYVQMRVHGSRRICHFLS